MMGEISTNYTYSPLIAISRSYDGDGTTYLAHRRDFEGCGLPEVCLVDAYREDGKTIYVESDGTLDAAMIPSMIHGIALLQAAGLIATTDTTTAAEVEQPEGYNLICRLAGVDEDQPLAIAAVKAV